MDTTNGTIVRKVTISGVSNVDWEDIARDEEYGYIGDFGNNNGTRTDLKIYKFALEDLEEESLTAEVISFNYPDQADFSSRPQNHNFDAEALIAFGDSLYIFSKNWANQRTKLYVLPKVPGSYAARLGGDIFAGGLITGADINTEDSVVLLTAYTKLLQPFFWLLWDFNEGDLFGGNKRKITLNLPLHQVEGGAWIEDGRYFISNEKLTTLGNVAPALHVINTSDWVSEVVSGVFPARSFLGHLQVFPNPSAGLVYVSWYDRSVSVSEIELTDMTGKVVGRQQVQPGATQGQLDMTGIAAGNYTIIVRTNEGVFTDRVIYAPYSTK